MFDAIFDCMEKIEKKYPGLNVLQLGFITLYLGYLRCLMGHENARSTLRDYIHPEILPNDIRLCVDFIEREIFALTKSKLDIDFYKMGNRSRFRPDSKYISKSTEL